MKPSAAMANGVSFVCSHCTKFWWGIERRLDGCKATHDKTPCAGPVRGMGFPQYDGPLKGQLKNFCFATGRPSTMVICLPDGSEIGVTDKGIEVISSFSEGGEAPRFLVTNKPLDTKSG